MRILDDTLTVAVLGAATASISFTLSKAEVFKPLRSWIERHSTFFGKLINCWYCTSHWVALVLLAVTQPGLFAGLGMLSPVVVAFAMITVSAIIIRNFIE